MNRQIIDAPAWAAEILDQALGVTPANQRVDLALAFGAAGIAATVRLVGKDEALAQFSQLLIQISEGGD